MRHEPADDQPEDERHRDLPEQHIDVHARICEHVLDFHTAEIGADHKHCQRRCEVTECAAGICDDPGQGNAADKNQDADRCADHSRCQQQLFPRNLPDALRERTAAGFSCAAHQYNAECVYENIEHAVDDRCIEQSFGSVYRFDNWKAHKSDISEDCHEDVKPLVILRRMQRRDENQRKYNQDQIERERVNKKHPDRYAEIRVLFAEHQHSVIECVDHHERRGDIEQNFCELLFCVLIQQFYPRKRKAEAEDQEQLAHLFNDNSNMHRFSFPVYFLRTNSTPSVFGPQWLEIVEPACVSTIASKRPDSRTAFSAALTASFEAAACVMKIR